MTRVALALILLSVVALPSLALDEIELKGGGTIRGEIVEETDTLVVIKPTFGGRIEIERRRIAKISKIAASDEPDEPTDRSRVEERAGYLLYDRARKLKGYRVVRRLRRDDAIIFETETMFFGGTFGGDVEPRLWLHIFEECGPDLEPRTFVYREKVGDASEFLRTGRIVDGRLEISEVRRGEERKRSMLAPAALRFASAARREVFKRSDSLGDDGLEITVFDPIAGEPVTETWTRAGTESVEWERKAVEATVLRVVRRGSPSEWRVTATGMVLAAELNGPDVTIVRVPFDRVETLMKDGELEDAVAGRLVNTHADPRSGFSIHKPGSAWEFQPGKGDRMVVLAETKMLFAYVDVFRDARMPKGTELATFAENIRRRLAGASSDFEKESEAFGTLGGAKAYRLIARHRNKGEDLRSLVVITIKDDVGWVVTATCPVKYFEQARPVFEGILESFAWIE